MDRNVSVNEANVSQNRSFATFVRARVVVKPTSNAESLPWQATKPPGDVNEFNIYKIKNKVDKRTHRVMLRSAPC